MIVPALLSESKEQLQKMCDLCASFTDFVQIDIMDGEFVPSRSVTIDDVAGLNLAVRCEAHLMVKDAAAWLPAFKKIGCERVIFHYEAVTGHRELIHQIKAMGMRAGVAVNPATSAEEIYPIAPELDCVLFMSVNPGFYGAAFIPSVLEKISEFKRACPKVAAGIDGGVKPDNLGKIVSAGADIICVGSAILKAPDPARAYSQMSEAFKAVRGQNAQ